VGAGLDSPGLDSPDGPTVKRGTRFGASGNDSSDIDVGQVEGCSEDGGLDAVAVGEMDSDRALACDC
jgi:hypothetical protein